MNFLFGYELTTADRTENSEDSNQMVPESHLISLHCLSEFSVLIFLEITLRCFSGISDEGFFKHETTVFPALVNQVKQLHVFINKQKA